MLPKRIIIRLYILGIEQSFTLGLRMSCFKQCVMSNTNINHLILTYKSKIFKKPPRFMCYVVVLSKKRYQISDTPFSTDIKRRLYCFPKSIFKV